MDMSDKNNLELERRGDEQLTYNPPRMSGDWQFNDANFISSSSMGLVSNANVVMGCGDLAGPSYSSGGMVSSLDSSMWEHPLDSVSIGLNDMNVQCGGAIASENFPMFKNNMFVQSMAGMLPHSLSEFPTDSAFIERAARFSSFSGGHFGELLHPLGVHSVNTYAPGSEKMMHGPQEVLSGTAVKILPCRQPQSRDVNVSETSRDVSLPQDQGAVDGGSPMNKTMPQRSHREAKQGVSLSGNDSDVPEYSGGGSRENMGPSSVKRLGGSKRKRATQDIESDQAKVVQQQSGETRKKQTVSTAKKSNEKQSSQNTDPPKGEYIHVRARRGQATNSHSLAERVRREKISERMKFLQDLVPGCSKVTGKAVMLDEIINYVQSLQRQVEFLSMKLATVHPKLDFNIEQLLAKDHILSARSCPSGVGSSPGMPTAYPPLHPSQPPILQPGHPSIGDCPDLLRRTVSSQLTNSGEGYKDPDHQLPNAWEDELHNVVQMGFSATDPLTSEDANCPTAQGSMKAES